MTDRPDLSELLDAVRLQLETAVLPVIRSQQRLYFQTLVALNLLKIAQREIIGGADIQRAEWVALNVLSNTQQAVPERDTVLQNSLAARHRTLCAAIRRGDYDSPEASTQLAAFLEPIVMQRLELNNPTLAQRLREELSSGGFAE